VIRAPVLAAALALCATDAAAINKCTKDGKITYQEDKCPEDAKAGALKVAPASPPPEIGSTEGRKEDAESLAWAVAHMERCKVLSPEYARNALKVMGDFRRQHGQAFAQFEHTKEYQEILRERRANTAEIAKDPAMREEIVKFCGMLKDKPPATSTGTAANAKGIPADIDHVIDVEAAFNVCAYGSRRWFDENREPYEAWAKRNFALTSRIHGDYELEMEFQSRSARRTSGEPGLCSNVAAVIRK
jgi:hypothetical protein